jgi:hypothetical protein
MLRRHHLRRHCRQRDVIDAGVAAIIIIIIAIIAANVTS